MRGAVLDEEKGLLVKVTQDGSPVMTLSQDISRATSSTCFKNERDEAGIPGNE